MGLLIQSYDLRFSAEHVQEGARMQSAHSAEQITDNKCSLAGRLASKPAPGILNLSHRDWFLRSLFGRERGGRISPQDFRGRL